VDDSGLLGIGKASRELGISVSKLRRMADAGFVPFAMTEGGHRRFDVPAVRRSLASRGIRIRSVVVPSAGPDWAVTRSISGLDEAEVWTEASDALGLERGSEAYSVFHYTLTEMVNNAIDHSGGTTVLTSAWHNGTISFEVLDDGVGAFLRLQTDLGLPDLETAVLQLSKGKGTSDPARHSGQGIFFTSKVLDQFELEANGLVWTVDNDLGDQALGVGDPGLGGTVVRGRFSAPPKRTTLEVFRAYSNEDFQFTRTRPSVKLAETATTFVSRSEAKRLMARLEGFEQVELDFAGVDAVGQGFVDEVFRVWASDHPQAKLVATNMNSAVEFMVRRGLG
jgi:anti-sigma regulatory factor (Ser/Thr protein kinase)